MALAPVQWRQIEIAEAPTEPWLGSRAVTPLASMFLNDRQGFSRWDADATGRRLGPKEAASEEPFHPKAGWSSSAGRLTANTAAVRHVSGVAHLTAARVPA